MKWSNSNRMKLVVDGCLAVILLGINRANADFTFGEPTNLGANINSSSNDSGPLIFPDGLTLFLVSDRPGGKGGNDLWMSERPTTHAPWTQPVNIGPPVNSFAREAGPRVSVDALALFFVSDRPGGQGGNDLWVSERPTTSAPWGTPVNLGPRINSSAYDGRPSISADGLLLLFWSERPGGYGGRDIWMATRPTINDPWAEPTNLGPAVNTPSLEASPTLSTDGSAMIFPSDRPGGAGGVDLWMTIRPAADDSWETPFNLGPTVNSSATESSPHISADGRILYFYSNRSGGFGSTDIYQVSIIPIVDLNGDEIVDAADMCIMVDHWGTDNSLCDIGPMPWGDGKVDVEDLKVLAEHLFEQVEDPTLIAHWPLDEAQGDIAYNSAADCDGTLMGNPLWQPEGGIVDGALHFDGIDDCISTDFVLNPADGMVSVVAWIQGGAPGQVVISQEGGADWLLTDTEGNLISELRNPGRNGSPILSQTNIIDGNWHRIGFVWDGSNRTLYVDGVAVAEDTQDDLEGSDSGLYIGCGKDMEAGTFWSGLIDDVRIYNRAVIP